uniref:Uncharacterized protein n=1 Tax=Nelumbo nucifera TaxID=4432 RepID=A0A822YRT7_NELNU|nr:TPA_asm: hypothetical protein HUJ06_007535 [Nelumbo nucifera]
MPVHKLGHAIPCQWGCTCLAQKRLRLRPIVHLRHVLGISPNDDIVDSDTIIRDVPKIWQERTGSLCRVGPCLDHRPCHDWDAGCSGTGRTAHFFVLCHCGLWPGGLRASKPNTRTTLGFGLATSRLTLQL